jgi:dipeptidyl aminopeptidase/acylaminoacyl peptidase
VIQRVFVLVSSLCVLAPTVARAQGGYRLPPEEVVRILDAPRAPTVSVSPDREWLVLSHQKNMPSLTDMAQPMLRIGGRRINSTTNGSFSPSLITGFSIMRMADGSERAVMAPAAEGWGPPSFAPNSERFRVTRDTDSGIELWIGSVSSASLERLDVPPLNGARGSACSWLSDSEHMVCHFVPEGRGPAPERPRVPASPVVQETSGIEGTVRTYQDLLKDPHDIELYDFYMTSQPAIVNVRSGAATPLGGAAIYSQISTSPSEEYFFVERRVGPYSYLVPDSRFPEVIEVWNRSGEVVASLGTKPLQDAIPIGGAQTFPRSHEWVENMPHTLVYVEALDGGDPRVSVPHRDRLLMLGAPFTGAPVELARTEYRADGIGDYGEDGLAMVTSSDRSSRMTRTWQVDLGDPGAEPRLVWERNSQDSYSDPGDPVASRNSDGDYLLVQDGDWIYLDGDGASPDGAHPFLDRMNVQSGEVERLWQSDVDSYEVFEALLDERADRILTRRESKTEPANYYVRDLRSGERMALTSFEDPHPQLTGVARRFVKYQRSDGVELSGTLYLPPGYREGERIPAVVWAYPREYTDPVYAGQVRTSPNRFTRISGYSHLFFLTQGYAVFDGATMPIVGDGETANDGYVEQLVASAQAAVDQLVEMGISERDRIGIGGHSYGAFMTANLLAHSDLFQAGIARSGAYNRSLTPFGFQNEQRTFWEAPEVYFAMSPFMHADKIDEPLLMIHGTADNNSGTFPVQSERMYHALKGHGATVRLVMLPHESHGYQARESVMHALSEMIEWFEKYVKKVEPRAVTD